MPRLPTPGGDSGNWGEILNEYLRVSLSADGELNTDSVGRDQLKADSVTAYNLANGSVTDDKLADQSVTAAKLAPGTLTKAAVGLGNVDNTSDSDKPVSTATQTALDTKVTAPTGSVSDNALVRFDGTSGKVVQGSGVHLDDNGKIGIGTNSPSSSLDIVSNADMTTTTASGSATQLYVNANLGNSTRYATSVSSRLRLVTNASSALTENDNGFNAVSASPLLTGDGTVNSFAGYLSRGIYYGGTVSKHYLYRAVLPQDQSAGLASIGTLYGFYASGLTSSLSAKGYAFYQSGENDFNFFAGKTGINTESPTHSLTLGSASNGIALYNTTDQATNYERMRMYWASNTLNIGTEAGGTGNVRTIRLASSISILELGTNVGIGSSAAMMLKRDHTGIGTLAQITSVSLVASTSTQHGVVIDPTVNQTGDAGYTMLKINPTENTIGTGGRRLADFQVNGNSRFIVTASGNIHSSGTINGRDIVADGEKLDALTSNSTPQVSTAGATFTIPVTEGTSRITLSANATASFAETPASTTTFVRTLVLIQAASGGPYTLTLPTVEWASDANAPTMPTVANAEMIVHLYWTGAAWRGMFGGYFYP